MGRRRGKGEGSIYQREDGRWSAAVSVGYAYGKRKRKQVYGATREEVAKKINKLLEDQCKGMLITDDRQTVNQFLSRWLQESAKGRTRPSTFKSYEQIIQHHINPHVGHIALTKLTPQQVQTMLNAISKEGLSPRTVQYVRAVLRVALSTALKWGLVHRNVAALTDPPRAERKSIRALDAQEARALLVAADDNRLGALFSVALAVGLRLGEALGLKWDDVDLTGRTLRIHRTLQRSENGLVFVEPKSSTSRRTIVLPDTTLKTLARHRARQAEERLAAGSAWENTGLVFTSGIGRPLDDANVRRAFRTVLKAAGLPPMRIHDLRHTCATLLVAQGVHPRVVMETLGHSQISLTMNTYSHVLPVLNRDAAERMDMALSAAV